MRAQFITSNEVAEVMGVSRTKAYQIVRAMNKELKEMGYINEQFAILTKGVQPGNWVFPRGRSSG